MPLTIENYLLVVELLQERFGRKETIVESLYFKLQNLPIRLVISLLIIQQVSETIEKVLRQLEAQGESIDEQKGNHFNDMCDKFTTLTERKQILSQQRRCFICLKVGHVLKDCPSSQKKVCCHW